MVGIEDQVMQHGRRTSKRHVVVALDRRVRVADHVPVLFRDEYEDIRSVELRAEERGVVIGRTGPRSQEAPPVEVMMLLDEKCTEPAKTRNVSADCTPDEGPGRRLVCHWACSVRRRAAISLVSAPDHLLEVLGVARTVDFDL